MGIINAAQRHALPSEQFGLPAQRAYPVNDRAHAANAKARATQQVRAGNLSPSAKAQIDAKANRVLGHPNRHRNLGAYLHPRGGRRGT